MIARPHTADTLRQALASLLERPNARLEGFRRPRSESLRQPPYDGAFIDRCRLALSGLLGLNDEGVIQVCSPQRKEGRSSVAAALSLVLARTRGRGRVLLVDLDFDRPAQAGLFSIAPAPGLADFLEGRDRLRALSGGPGGQLWLIPAGDHLGDPTRLIHMLGVDGMLAVFRERFQWVVLDLPPMLSNPEARTLAHQADWHVVVGRHRRTTVSDLRKVHELIGSGRRAGFILTADSTRIPGWIRRRL